MAGDLLPKPTTEQLLATSFLRQGKRNNEGGIIDEEFRVEYVNERAELMGKAFMGLTVACARCHDHKYDVISQEEYYQLAGYFNSIDERGIHSGGANGAPDGADARLAAPPKQTAALEEAHKATRSRTVGAATRRRRWSQTLSDARQQCGREPGVRSARAAPAELIADTGCRTAALPRVC